MKTKLFGLSRILIVVNERFHIYCQLIPPSENVSQMKILTKLCLQKKIWFFKICFTSDSFTLLQQIISTSDNDFNKPPISWRERIRCSFWSCCFCNLIFFFKFSHFHLINVVSQNILFSILLFFNCTMLLVSDNFNKFLNFWFWFLIKPITTFLIVKHNDLTHCEILKCCILCWFLVIPCKVSLR